MSANVSDEYSDASVYYSPVSKFNIFIISEIHP